MPSSTTTRRAAEVFRVFLRLGCTSFGGPIARLGYFQRELIDRRRWTTPAAFAEIVALAQTLPGPASSQVGFALGLLRAGWPGGLAAFTAFTLPSAVLMTAFALGSAQRTGPLAAAVLHGLQLVAVAVVAQAVLTMQRTLAPDAPRLLLAVASTALVLFIATPYTTLLIVLLGAAAGLLFLKPTATSAVPQDAPQLTLPRHTTLFAAAAFVLLLAISLFTTHPQSVISTGAPRPQSVISTGARLCAEWRDPQLACPIAPNPLQLFAAFYRSGALVFGGGHVVLPLLESAIVHPGWVAQPAFLTGYGAAQALPGPLFTFAAYLGASARPANHPIAAALIALLGIFTPGLLAMAAVLPLWTSLRQLPRLRSALAGVNAAVVGLLLAALVRPLATSTLRTPLDILFALAALLLLTLLKTPSWAVVLAAAMLAATYTLAFTH